MKFTIANLTIQINRRAKPAVMPDLSNTSYDKVFCIRDHKTGTTSLEYVLGKLRFPWGINVVAKCLNCRPNFISGKSSAFVYSARAFQSTPFI